MTIRSTWLALTVGLGLLTAHCADAKVTLIAKETLTGSSAGADADLSGLTGNLENGVPANLLGGIGSGIAWAGGMTFIAVPDRGPNALTYNAAVDDTASYICRIQTISMTLTPQADVLPFKLTPALTATTLLYSTTPLSYGSAGGLPNGAPAINAPSKFYFTGRSDNFGAGDSGNPGHARLDPEAIRVSRDGKSVFVSDEYGPYVYQFDRATGQRLRSYALPPALYVANLSPSGKAEIKGNKTGRIANRGMEGLAITPDGTKLIGAMQSALAQDTAADGKMIRLIEIDIASGAIRQFAYLLTAGSGVNEIVALNGHEFLLIERDGKGLGDDSAAGVKQVFKIDLAKAADISGMTSEEAAAAAVGKSLFLDIMKVLNGPPNNVAKDQIPAKFEGIAIGNDVMVDGSAMHTLWITNDNDFVAASAGPNTIYVFGFTDDDLQGSILIPQQFQ